LTQFSSEIAGNVIEYLPCAHEIQLSSELAAKVVEYFPCTQFTQETIETAPTVIEYVPVLQFSQLLFPGISLKVPAGHTIHTFSNGGGPGENPASQIQSV